MVLGWGLTRDGEEELSKSLQEAEVRTITNTACELEFPMVVTPSNLCISGEGGRSTCSGDSGGPLLLQSETSGLYKQVGVTSFGSLPSCQSGIAAGFTRVASYLQWIETVTSVIIED